MRLGKGAASYKRITSKRNKFSYFFFKKKTVKEMKVLVVNSK